MAQPAPSAAKRPIVAAPAYRSACSHGNVSAALVAMRGPPVVNQTAYQHKLYNNAQYAGVIDKWGEDTVWIEVLFLLAGCTGRVLDIACGTGRNIHDLTKTFSHLDVHGTDISPLLLKMAASKGIPEDHLTVADNGKPLPYPDQHFDCAYSIGSFEHFSVSGLATVLTETARVTERASFHMVPVSSRNRNEGWRANTQPAWRMSVDWWVAHFNQTCSSVSVLHSRWGGGAERGIWICCYYPYPSRRARLDYGSL